LAAHTRGLPGHDDISATLAAIRDNRQLLATPDPVAPVARQAADLLRATLKEKMTAYQERLEQGLADLQATNEWDRLNQTQRESMLQRPNLRPVTTSSLSSDRDLLAVLGSRSLGEWDTALDALPTRLTDAQAEVIRLIQPEVREVSLPKPLFEKPADVERWIKDVREALLGHVNAGHPVRIK